MGLFFFAYVLLRIVLLDLTNDELGSLVDVYRKGFLACLRFDNVDAQNHFLSGMLAIAFLKLLPFDEVLTTRLPSLLGFGLYLYATLRISRWIPDRRLGLLLYVSFSANAFLLDFFSLARGYGLAVGCTALSLYFLLAGCREPYGSEPERRFSGRAVGAATLAVLTNLAFLNYFFGLAAVLLVRTVRASQKDLDLGPRVRALGVDNLPLLVAGLVLGGFYYRRVSLLMERGLLYFGGETGFIADTVGSLVEKTAYQVSLPMGFPAVLALLVTAASLYVAVISIRRMLRDGTARQTLDPTATLSVLLLVMAVFAVAAHHTFGVRFVVGRAALMFVPLLIGQAGFFAAGATKAYSKGVAVALALYSLLGLTQMNLSHTLSWQENAGIPELVRDLGALPEAGTRDVFLASSEESKNTIWYYSEKILGMPVDPRVKTNRFMRWFGWLTVYSIKYALPQGEQFHMLPETNYVYLCRRDLDRKLPFSTELVREYPASGCQLRRRLGFTSPPYVPIGPAVSTRQLPDWAEDEVHQEGGGQPKRGNHR